jgi:hypothetical protein
MRTTTRRRSVPTGTYDFVQSKQYDWRRDLPKGTPRVPTARQLDTTVERIRTELGLDSPTEQDSD